MKRNIVKALLGCVITVCITLSAVGYAGHLLDPAWTEGAMDAIKAFHTLDEDSLEVIIYGSSHAWKGCDTMEMYKKYGLAAYNYGCNWQAINTSLLFLQDSLRTQTPKVVCIDTFKVDTVKHDTDMDGQIYYTRAISDFEGKAAYLKQCFGNDIGRYASYYFPLIMFHENWNNISRENFSLSNINKWIRSMGYCSNGNAVQSVKIGDYQQFEQKKLTADSVEILDKMVSVCKEKNIQLIFYTCPWEGENNYADAMAEYTAENGCVYLNLFEYMDDMGLDEEADFGDPGHLNDTGSRKVADFLGEFIVNHYDVTDMRTVEGNMWELNIQK